MKEVKRHDILSTSGYLLAVEREQGQYVLYSDYESLHTKLAEKEKELDYLDRIIVETQDGDFSTLYDENKSLRKELEKTREALLRAKEIGEMFYDYRTCEYGHYAEDDPTCTCSDCINIRELRRLGDEHK